MELKTHDPFELFSTWLQEAEAKAGMEHPNAMAVATVDASGRPSVRILLLKGFSSDGFIFFTNYSSRKAAELDFNPQCSLCFYWDKLGRQVRVEGSVEKLSVEDSEAYFHTRPRMSQIGAWASHQSQEIPSRAYLEERVKEYEEKFAGQEVPLPEFWGGFLLRPARFEFWQHGEFRLHDRFSFESAPDSAGEWTAKRLSP